MTRRQREYLQAQMASGLKVGDRVHIVRKARSHERSWRNSWVTDMSDSVGKICKITGDEGDCGLELDNEFCYPYFVLEKVEIPSRNRRGKKFSRGEREKSGKRKEEVE